MGDERRRCRVRGWGDGGETRRWGRAWDISRRTVDGRRLDWDRFLSRVTLSPLVPITTFSRDTARSAISVSNLLLLLYRR